MGDRGRGEGAKMKSHRLDRRPHRCKCVNYSEENCLFILFLYLLSFFVHHDSKRNMKTKLSNEKNANS